MQNAPMLDEKIVQYRKNITFISPYDLPDINITRNFDFAKSLSELGFNVSIIVNNYDHRQKIRVHKQTGYVFRQKASETFSIYWISTLKYRGLVGRAFNALEFFALSFFVMITRLRSSDVIIGDTVPLTTASSCVLTAKLIGSKSIVQIRDVWPAALISDGAIGENSIMAFVFRALEKYAYRNADLIITSLPKVDFHIKTLLGQRKMQLEYIPNPYRIEQKESSVSTSGIEVFKLIYAGGMGNAHDIDTIIHAAKYVIDNGYQIKIDFYGDGKRRIAAEALARSLGLENLTFHGTVAKKELETYIACSDLCIATVLDSDAYRFGVNLNKIYDYMANKKPIILGLRGVCDPVTASGCGFVVPPEDPKALAEAIEKAMNYGDASLANMGLKGFNYLCQHHDIDVLAKKFKHAIEGIV
jgi:glycosyltransferase involved in cell wall biosynthesis